MYTARKKKLDKKACVLDFFVIDCCGFQKSEEYKGFCRMDRVQNCGRHQTCDVVKIWNNYVC